MRPLSFSTSSSQELGLRAHAANFYWVVLRKAAAGEPRLMTEDKTGALFHVVPSDAANRYGSLVRERKHLLSPSLREN
jgi:hypothetical protein